MPKTIPATATTTTYISVEAATSAAIDNPAKQKTEPRRRYQRIIIFNVYKISFWLKE
jgi:hypothetical protein